MAKYAPRRRNTISAAGTATPATMPASTIDGTASKPCHRREGEQREGTDADERLLADGDEAGATGEQIPQLRERQHREDVEQAPAAAAAGEGRQGEQEDNSGNGEERRDRGRGRRRDDGEPRIAPLSFAGSREGCAAQVGAASEPVQSAP